MTGLSRVSRTMARTGWSAASSVPAENTADFARDSGDGVHGERSACWLRTPTLAATLQCKKRSEPEACWNEENSSNSLPDWSGVPTGSPTTGCRTKLCFFPAADLTIDLPDRAITRTPNCSFRKFLLRRFQLLQTHHVGRRLFLADLERGHFGPQSSLIPVTRFESNTRTSFLGYGLSARQAQRCKDA